MTEKLFTLSSKYLGEYKEKGSKFISIIHPISNLDEYRSHLAHYKAEHPKANHVCSAYRFHQDDRIDEFASDDGEPKNSSGQPILHSLQRNNLINVACFVVRYFGGTKLGISGLINAYTKSTENALIDCKTKLWQPMSQLKIVHDYEHTRFLESLISQFDGKIIEQKFTIDVVTIISLPKSKAEKFDRTLLEKSSGKIVTKYQ
ncbi:MAG: YigZ family protein [Candidatus Marinimicrobia bacterium]|nr:YigZ family protein [Candidatus Neomarinimicrobiota bacterium]MBL7023637.1 YigZ family protein [Candidatus Neomarinimicrobiota bacterium]MBL7109824.1 YigZ family protein [Candidatus Neomarinimicrobiota bacterium]